MSRQTLIDQEERQRYEQGMRVLKGPQEFVMYQPDLTVRVWYGAEPDSYNEHWHSAVEVILPSKGEIRCDVEDIAYTVGAQDVMFIPAGKLHRLQTPDGSVRNLILFDPACINAIHHSAAVQQALQAPLLLLHDADAQLCEQIRSILFTLMKHYYDHQPAANLLCYSELLRVYALLGQHYQANAAPNVEEQQPMTEPIRHALNRVFDYVGVHYAEKLSLDDAAAVAGFSKFYFSRIFSQYTGMPFSQYLLRQRIDSATRLLITTNSRLLDIAMQSGFSSLSTFNRVFRHFHGCTPTEYRTMYQAQP